jgi:hypothetical protein
MGVTNDGGKGGVANDGRKGDVVDQPTNGMQQRELLAKWKGTLPLLCQTR